MNLSEHFCIWPTVQLARSVSSSKLMWSSSQTVKPCQITWNWNLSKQSMESCRRPIRFAPIGPSWFCAFAWLKSFLHCPQLSIRLLHGHPLLTRIEANMELCVCRTSACSACCDWGLQMKKKEWLRRKHHKWRLQLSGPGPSEWFHARLFGLHYQHKRIKHKPPVDCLISSPMPGVRLPLSTRSLSVQPLLLPEASWNEI